MQGLAMGPWEQAQGPRSVHASTSWGRLEPAARVVRYLFCEGEATALSPGPLRV
jgi:hypothetical protein